MVDTQEYVRSNKEPHNKIEIVIAKNREWCEFYRLRERLPPFGKAVRIGEDHAAEEVCV